MTRHYEVSPTTLVPYQREPAKREWVTDQLVPADDPLNNGASGFLVKAGVFDLVLATEDPTRPGQYENWLVPRYALAFEGASVTDPAARVAETSQFSQIPLADLKVRKEQDLTAQVDFMLSSNCETNLTPNWVIRIEPQDRTWIASVNGFLQDRMRDRVYDNDPKDYWARDVPIRAINVNTNRYLRETVNEPQWGTIMKDIGLHDFSATDAADLAQQDIDTAYGDGTGTPGGPEWQALAAIDVTEAAYGWPPVYQPSVGPTAGNGR